MGIACTEPHAPTPQEPLQEATPTPAPTPPPAPASGRRFAAHRIVVAWTGAGVAPVTPRSRAAAEALAGEALMALSTMPFEDVARRLSDGPEAARGGRLGTFVVPTWHPHVEAALAALSPGAWSTVLDTPDGYVIVRRDALQERRVTAHVWRWDAEASHSRDEAFTLATRASERLRAGRSDVHADHTESTLLSAFQWPRPLEDAAFALGAGEVSDPVVTADSWVVLQRDD